VDLLFGRNDREKMKLFDLQESLNKANIQEAIDQQHGEAFVDWAIELLCQGETNENIAILAGLRQPLQDEPVGFYLGRATKDLGLTAQTSFEAFWRHIQNVAQAIIAGDLPAGEGCEHLEKLFIRFRYWEQSSPYGDQHGFYEPYLCDALARFPSLYSRYIYTKEESNEHFLNLVRQDIIQEAQILLGYSLPDAHRVSVPR
jgi:hypothetical protein